MNEHGQLLAKWLKILMYAHVASIAASLLSLLPINDTWNTWVSMGVDLVVTACMFSMAPANPRYKTAGILRAASLALALLNNAALALVASILSLVAVYQEYSGHSEVSEPIGGDLSRKWHSLFNWQIIVGILSAVVSMVATLVLVMMQVDASTIVTVILAIITAVSVLLEVLFIRYVKQMIGWFEAGEV